jgi:GntR family transcriptional regulator
MFVNDGARKLLLKAERERFLAEEWPQVVQTIQRLGLTLEELMASRGAGRTPVRKG